MWLMVAVAQVQSGAPFGYILAENLAVCFY
jgi:hypothetical protein